MHWYVFCKISWVCNSLYYVLLHKQLALDNKLLLILTACHESCADSCSGSSPKDCEKCKEGWDMTDEDGCKGICRKVYLARLCSSMYAQELCSCPFLTDSKSEEKVKV